MSRRTAPEGERIKGAPFTNPHSGGKESSGSPRFSLFPEAGRGSFGKGNFRARFFKGDCGRLEKKEFVTGVAVRDGFIVTQERRWKVVLAKRLTAAADDPYRVNVQDKFSRHQHFSESYKSVARLRFGEEGKLLKRHLLLVHFIHIIIMKKTFIGITSLVGCMASSQAATMVITEWMYQGGGAGEIGEFIELTNVSSEAINLTGWSFDDDSRNPGTVPLSGIVQSGQSVIITDMDATAFRTVWGLDASVIVFGNNLTNLGRADEINLYNGTTLVDRLTYSDQNFPGSPRTQAISGVTDPEHYGTNDVTKWRLSAISDGPTVGDGISWTSTQGEIGSPGVAVIPEPTSALLLGIAGMTVGLCRRRQS